MLTREENRVQNLREFEEGRTRLRSRPRALFVELTENCNFSCPMCRSGGPFDRSKNMSFELFEEIAEELFPTAEIVDLRGWGESTILKRFPEFVDRTLSYGCRVRIVTNLSVPNEEMWRHLVRNRALIAVSFDAGEEKTFETLRSGAKFRTIVRNLEILADEGRASGVGTDNVHLNVVVQEAALEELSQIVTLAGRLGFRVHLNPVTLGHDDPDNLRFHRDRLAASLAETARVAEETGTEVRIDAALDEAWALTEHTAKTCTHPWMYCYFNYAGKVGFCDHLIGQPGESYLLGDLRTASFEEIWNGPSYRRLRAEHAAWEEGLSERFEECNWCYRNRYVDFDPETHPGYESHVVRLTPANCPAVSGEGTPRPPSPGAARRSLPLTVVSHPPHQS
ncbi:radical SAM protein [Streptomyces zingiberis]|uniref:Radical SAM protein n=1 Tax=Streptomyces zingiberis TaxID=2053010 RepID=A0ABX1C569_9ACTN|nr:radical SAM protein [Streptomyces zingiberis]NJQ03067.1 radical SAM protein [Streptomyces zingiberis]